MLSVCQRGTAEGEDVILKIVASIRSVLIASDHLTIQLEVACCRAYKASARGMIRLDEINVYSGSYCHVSVSAPCQGCSGCSPLKLKPADIVPIKLKYVADVQVWSKALEISGVIAQPVQDDASFHTTPPAGAKLVGRYWTLAPVTLSPRASSIVRFVWANTVFLKRRTTNKIAG